MHVFSIFKNIYVLLFVQRACLCSSIGLKIYAYIIWSVVCLSINLSKCNAGYEIKCALVLYDTCTLFLMI